LIEVGFAVVLSLQLKYVKSRETKTRLIARYIEEAPTPTVALEYTFGRKSRPMSSIKDVTNIWELAGGAMLSKLVDIPLIESNIHTCAFVLALDLSQVGKNKNLFFPGNAKFQ
jgi:hypothetical protein